MLTGLPRHTTARLHCLPADTLLSWHKDEISSPTALGAGGDLALPLSSRADLPVDTQGQRACLGEGREAGPSALDSTGSTPQTGQLTGTFSGASET